MKTTGQILQQARLSKKISLDDVARITKIRANFLIALEADDYGKLPSATVAKGFIKNYAKFLGLNPDHLLSLFRRDFIENQQGQIVPRGMVEPVSKVSFWTPRATIIAIVTFIFTLFGAYLIYQYTLLIGPPSLVVTEPKDKIEVTDTTVAISGTTDPEATLQVNDQPVVLEKGGRFFLRVPVTPGENKITIKATGKSGKSTIIYRTINLK